LEELLPEPFQLFAGHVALALFRFVVIELVRNRSQVIGRIDEAPQRRRPDAQ